MIDRLIRKFIKNADEIQNESVRFAYGKLLGYVGVICNLLLFGVKLAIGILTNSVAIISDAMNNLSDVLTALVTVLGYRIAAKPADKEHPFGHGRVEYIISFMIAAVIFSLSFELFKQGYQQIIHPNQIVFSWILVVILLVSVGLKLWVSFLNRTIGRRIDNLAMIAVGQDARNDALATCVTVAALVLSGLHSSFPFDGAATMIIACFILKSGWELVREIMDRLIGRPADHQLIQNIHEIILKYPQIKGLHDILIHDYGPGAKIGSAHAEVDAKMELLVIHEIIDRAEREVAQKLKVMLTLHIDPIEFDDPVTNAYLEDLTRILKQIDPQIRMHDFHTAVGKNRTDLLFDLVVPYEFHLSDVQIKSEIDAHFAKYPNQIETIITFDHDFIEERK